MDPEEIARKELEKMAKKKRKHEKKLLKSQARNLHSPSGLSVNSSTQSSDSDGGGGGLSPDPPDGCKGPLGGSQNPLPGSCDPTAPAFYPANRGGGGGCATGPGCPSKEASPSASECAGPPSSTARGPGFPKLNPFSVESLLSDSPPRRKAPLDFPPALAPCAPTARTLIGKGHFLLYPITQPLGFIVPQAALKSHPGQEPPQRGSPLPAANPSPDPAPPKSSTTAAISSAPGPEPGDGLGARKAAPSPPAASPLPYGDSSSAQADEPKSPRLLQLPPATDACQARDNSDCRTESGCPAEASHLDCEEVDME